MSNNNLDIDKLREMELPGAGTINPIIDWIKGLGTTSDFLLFSNNPYGSVNLDMDFTLLASRILAMIQLIQADFKGTVNGESLEVQAGHVLLPDKAYSLAKYTRNLSNSDNGKGLAITLTSSTATYSWGTVHDGALLNGNTITLPLCSVHQEAGIWYVKHQHIGAYVFVFPPAPFIAGWSSGVRQSLDHGTDGSLFWNTYNLC